MIEIKIMEPRLLKEVYETYLACYSNILEHRPTFDQFLLQLQSRDFAESISLVVMDNKRIVGFSLMGMRQEHHHAFAYTIGLGVLEEYREKGIAKRMIVRVKELLRHQGFDAWILETLQNDMVGKTIVESVGFRPYRTLANFLLPQDSTENQELKIVESLDIDVDNYWDFTPSWQNMISDNNLYSDNYVIYVLGDALNPIAYSIVHKHTHTLMQFAVRNDIRGQGFGEKILNSVKATYGNKLYATNIPTSSSLYHFLVALGGIEYLNVTEYILTLKQ